jgi:translation elongation factor EF-4
MVVISEFQTSGESRPSSYGDVARKRKLLEKQKEGKKSVRQCGKVASRRKRSSSR